MMLCHCGMRATCTAGQFAASGKLTDIEGIETQPSNRQSALRSTHAMHNGRYCSNTAAHALTLAFSDMNLYITAQSVSAASRRCMN
jgi:hypothetical protein